MIIEILYATLVCSGGQWEKVGAMYFYFLSFIGDQKIGYLICCLGRAIHQSLALVLANYKGTSSSSTIVRKKNSMYKLLVLSTTVRALFYFQIVQLEVVFM